MLGKYCSEFPTGACVIDVALLGVVSRDSKDDAFKQFIYLQF